MTIKIFSLFLIFLFASITSLGQKLKDTVFIPNSDTMIVRNFKKSMKLEKEAYYVKKKLTFTRHHYYSKISYGYHTKFPEVFKQKLAPSRDFWPDGTLRITASFKNGKKEGSFRTFDQNGQPQCVCNYKAGKREGKQIIYKNGGLSEEIVYKDDTPWSIIKSFDEGGKWVGGTLKEGNGTFFIYDDKERLKKIEHYKLGVLIKTEKVKRK